MTSRVSNVARTLMPRRAARLAIAAVAALIVAADPAGAASRRAGRAVEAAAPREAGAPIMAIVSLKNQQVTIYDSEGWVLRAPVSTGQKGRETPAGVFSVIQKDADHHSNLYDDAFMPHMQRITWSGIALHGGPLPGHPASHGCVRMPYDFAERLFGETRLGMRVIIAPGDAVPTEIAHPALFSPKPDAGAHAAALAAEAAEATRKRDEARIASGTASREASRAALLVRKLDNLKARAEEQLAAADAALDAAHSDGAKARAEDAKQKAAARVAELQAQWDTAKAELQAKLDTVALAREGAVTAEIAQAATTKAAREAARELDPVSIFISRKTQRLYVRRGFEPHPRESGHHPRCRQSHRYARLHGRGAHGHRPAMDRRHPGRWTSARRRRGAGSVRTQIAAATLRRSIPTRAPQRARSIASSFRRRCWTASRRRRRRDRPLSSRTRP